ncbi:MAG: DinB family protein [Chloroflexota bacterium]|nr:DinB family protein [Chloroflexota bacterium]MDE2948799.1 DinB family protein [Chloroflexota bacterium]
MNPDIKQFWDLNRMYTPLRDELMASLSDKDLAFSPGGENPTLGELCREIGETQYAYVQSFKTFKIDFSYRVNDDAYLTSVDKLKAWYAELDQQLEAELETINDGDVANIMMDRGGYEVPLHISLDILREALLIFYGKVSVYLKAMGMERTQMWRDWIA